MTRNDIDAVIDVFTPTAPTARSVTCTRLKTFRRLVAAAPKGLFMTGTPAMTLTVDTGTGYQTLCFVDQTNHNMRIGWYTDTYERTASGWRLKTRAMTFLRRSGEARRGHGRTTRPVPLRRTSGGTRRVPLVARRVAR